MLPSWRAERQQQVRSASSGRLELGDYVAAIVERRREIRFGFQRQIITLQRLGITIEAFKKRNAAIVERLSVLGLGRERAIVACERLL
jgi:hypothetical protein